MNGIPFDKYQALGNDFILFDMTADPMPVVPGPCAIRKLCDRHYGIGADGILLYPIESESADQDKSVQMLYFNADGYQAETCFNGLRCIGLHAIRTGFVQRGSHFWINSDFRNRKIRTRVTVDRNFDIVTISGSGTFDPQKIPVAADSEIIDQEISFRKTKLIGTAISVGNPHFVVWMDKNCHSGESRNPSEDLEQLNREVARYGPIVVNDPIFPQGTNFEIAVKLSDNKVIMAVWERGVGVTLACGSGATATVCAGVKSGRLPEKQPIEVRMAGGTLRITVDGYENLSITGEAHHTFSGVLNPAAFTDE